MSQVDLFDLFTSKPKTLTWVIKDFEKLLSEWSPPIKLSSNGYLKLNFLPNEVVVCDECVVIYLLPYLNSTATVYYRISLINEKGVKCNTQEGRVKKEFGCYYIFKRDYLLDKANGLLPDGKLTIYCEVFELADAECIESGLNKSNLVSLYRDNQSLFDSGELSDVVVAFGERELKAHKLILSARSEVFKKMFEHDLEESKRNRVDIEDLSAGAGEDLLKFIYTGKVGDLEQHVKELLYAADKYQIDSLKSYCELYLAMTLSISNAPKLLELSDMYSLVELKSKCINYITLHSTEFNFENWKELTTSRPELMFGLFQELGFKSKPK